MPLGSDDSIMNNEEGQIINIPKPNYDENDNNDNSYFYSESPDFAGGANFFSFNSPPTNIFGIPNNNINNTGGLFGNNNANNNTNYNTIVSGGLFGNDFGYYNTTQSFYSNNNNMFNKTGSSLFGNTNTNTNIQKTGSLFGNKITDNKTTESIFKSENTNNSTNNNITPPPLFTSNFINNTNTGNIFGNIDNTNTKAQALFGHKELDKLTDNQANKSLFENTNKLWKGFALEDRRLIIYEK